MGQQRPRDASDLLPPPAQGRPPRRTAVRGRPAPDEQRRVGRFVARSRRRQRHRSGQRDGPRDHRRRAREPRVHRPRDERLRCLQGQGRAVHARVRRARDGRPGRGHPRAGARVRDRAARDDLLDARHHRAPQRGRQRAGADLAGPADRSRRAVRQRRQPVARPEQRPGRRRHGRPPRSAAGLPARRERRAARQVRCRMGRRRAPAAGLAPVGHVRRHGAGRPDRGLLHRREPGPVRGRPEARDPPPVGPRLPGRPGPVPDQDRRARRRGPAGDRRLGRIRGDGHQLRAPRPARPQGGRATRRRTRRPGDHLRSGEPDGRRLGRGRRRSRVGRGPPPVAGPRRHVLQAARRARRDPVAVL